MKRYVVTKTYRMEAKPGQIVTVTNGYWIGSGRPSVLIEHRRMRTHFIRQLSTGRDFTGRRVKQQEPLAA